MPKFSENPDYEPNKNDWIIVIVLFVIIILAKIIINFYF